MTNRLALMALMSLILMVFVIGLNAIDNGKAVKARETVCAESREAV